MSEKTETPTGKRISEARARGQVARSHELNAAIALIGGVWLIQGPGQALAQNLTTILRDTLHNISGIDITSGWLRQQFMTDLSLVIVPLGEIILGFMALGVGITLAQTGFNWSSKREKFDLNRVNPLNGLRRLFSGEGIVEIAKSLLKLSIVGWMAYSYLSSNFQHIAMLSATDLRSGISRLVEFATGLIIRVGGAYLILAIADYLYQRWRLLRSLRMTKQELKEEFKQSEGDPTIKGRLRQKQRQMARMRMMANVPKADVIVTNPTHLAIAISYNSAEMSAPKVVAKGAYKIAEKIISIAQKSNVPVIQNIVLARAIYPAVEVDQEIPPDLYVAMAEVLAYVYRMRGTHWQTATSPNLNG